MVEERGEKIECVRLCEQRSGKKRNVTMEWMRGKGGGGRDVHGVNGGK